MSSVELRQLISEPARLRALTQAIRAKIPPHDVDDVLQSTLTDALTAASPPPDASALDRWLSGIARHKVADYYRNHRRREHVDANLDEHNAATDTHTEGARDLLRWVERELPQDTDAPRTLEWMMREAEGDHLEAIAEENQIPAPTVRQRISRMRRYLRERWAIQVAAALAVALAVGAYTYQRHRPSVEPEATEPTALVVRKLRDSALSDCRSGHWQICLEKLDRAKALDPAGDSAAAIASARAEIARAQQPAPAPSPSPSAEPMVPAGEIQKSAPPPSKKVRPAPQRQPRTPKTTQNSVPSQTQSSASNSVDFATLTPSKPSYTQSSKKSVSKSQLFDMDKGY